MTEVKKQPIKLIYEITLLQRAAPPDDFLSNEMFFRLIHNVSSLILHEEDNATIKERYIDMCETNCNSSTFFEELKKLSVHLDD